MTAFKAGTKVTATFETDSMGSYQVTGILRHGSMESIHDLLYVGPCLAFNSNGEPVGSMIDIQRHEPDNWQSAKVIEADVALSKKRFIFIAVNRTIRNTISLPWAYPTDSGVAWIDHDQLVNVRVIVDADGEVVSE